MDELAKLAHRLNVGWEKIENTPYGQERTRLEDFWLDLLKRYERTADRLGVPSTKWPPGWPKR